MLLIALNYLKIKNWRRLNLLTNKIFTRSKDYTVYMNALSNLFSMTCYTKFNFFIENVTHFLHGTFSILRINLRQSEEVEGSIMMYYMNWVDVSSPAGCGGKKWEFFLLSDTFCHISMCRCYVTFGKLCF